MNLKPLFYYRILLIGLAAFIFALQHPEELKQVDISQTDAYHYQVQAVNLVKYHTYPKLNLIGPQEQYFIDTNQAMGLSSRFALQFILAHPPVDDFSKPPFYTLLIASLYKVFGINPNHVYVLNIWLIAFIAFAQPFIGFGLMRWWGVLAGLISGFIYYNVTIPDAVNFYPHLPVQFFVLLLFWILTDTKDSLNKTTGFLTGMLLSMMVLTNGNVIFVPLLMMAFQFVKSIKQGVFSGFLSLCIGFFLLIVPWMVYANIKFYETKSERNEWVQQLWQNVTEEKVSGRVFKDRNIHTANDSLVMKQAVRKIYSKFCENGYIIISKQPFGDEILGCHNEYCANGNFHPEWRYINESYYSLHPSEKSSLFRIGMFYKNTPQAIIENITGKFKGTNNALSDIYFTLGLLFGAYLLLQKASKYWRLASFFGVIIGYLIVPTPIIVFLFILGCFAETIHAFVNTGIHNPSRFGLFVLTNTVIITIVFYGEPRYVQIVAPVIIILYAYLTLWFIKPSLKEIAFWLNYKNRQLLSSRLLRDIRVPEVVLMSGYFLIAALFSVSDLRQFTTESLVIYCAVLLYIGSVYALNSYTDYEADKLNPRLKHLGHRPRNFYLFIMLALLSVSLFVASFIGLRIVFMLLISFLLWCMYYSKPLRLKAFFPLGSVVHFFGGIIHFQIGFEMGQPWCYISFMYSLFFASLLSLGHLNHERIDAIADANSGIKTGTVKLGNRLILFLFYTGLVLGQMFWALLWKWNFISTLQFIAFFYLPLIVVLWLINKIYLLTNPKGIQTLFRWLLLISAGVILIEKAISCY